MMSLSIQQEVLIQDASRNAIQKGLEDVKQFWLIGQWLPDSNPYKKDCINELEKIFPKKSKVNHVNCPQLVEYIAASTVTHCFDGWSFLGRALDAELSGDPDTARHLGYYAELRAAMSLLAGHGIGIFNNKHIIIKDDALCYLFSGNFGTHKATWEVLQHWGTLQAGRDTLFNSIFPGNISLNKWLNHYPGSANFVASHWLKQWGLDIARMAKDRDARNVASYRPTAFVSSGSDVAQEVVSAVCKLWELCEPRADGGFQVMDRYILRASLHEAVRKKIEKPDKFKDNIDSDVQEILNSISPRDLSKSLWKEFLIDVKQHPVFIEAKGTLSANDIGHSRQVLSRALLLLRVATGSTSNLIKACGGSKDDLAFWWSGKSVSRRLWSPNFPPDQFSDLWEDINDVKDELNNVVNDPGTSYHRMWKQHGQQISVLPTTERVALWGLCL